MKKVSTYEKPFKLHCSIFYQFVACLVIRWSNSSGKIGSAKPDMENLVFPVLVYRSPTIKCHWAIRVAWFIRSCKGHPCLLTFLLFIQEEVRVPLQLFLAAKFKPPHLEYLGREDMGSVTVNMTLLALSLWACWHAKWWSSKSCCAKVNPHRACKMATDLDKEVLLAAELVVQVPQVGFLQTFWSLHWGEKSKEKALACWIVCPCDIYSGDKELRNAQSPPMQSPWEKRKKATIKTVKLICSSVMQLLAPIPKWARK